MEIVGIASLTKRTNCNQEDPAVCPFGWTAIPAGMKNPSADLFVRSTVGADAPPVALPMEDRASPGVFLRKDQTSKVSEIDAVCRITMEVECAVSFANGARNHIGLTDRKTCPTTALDAVYVLAFCCTTDALARDSDCDVRLQTDLAANPEAALAVVTETRNA